MTLRRFQNNFKVYRGTNGSGDRVYADGADQFPALKERFLTVVAVGVAFESRIGRKIQLSDKRPVAGSGHLRNQLAHASHVPPVNQATVKNAIQAIIDALDALYQSIYERRFPLAGRGLQSQSSF